MALISEMMLEYFEEVGDVGICQKDHLQKASKYGKRNGTMQYVEG